MVAALSRKRTERKSSAPRRYSLVVEALILLGWVGGENQTHALSQNGTCLIFTTSTFYWHIQLLVSHCYALLALATN